MDTPHVSYCFYSQDLRIYISEKDRFTQFNDSSFLFWELMDLEYGDWVGGPNGDGSYSVTDSVGVSEVSLPCGTQVLLQLHACEVLNRTLLMRFSGVLLNPLSRNSIGLCFYTKMTVFAVI